MDFLYGRDRKLSDYEDPDITDMLGPDPFPASMAMPMGVDEPFMTGLPTLTENENDWFNSIFDEAGLIYNDKNLGEAATQPCIKSEHSYSTNSLNPLSPLDNVGKMEDTDSATVFGSRGRDALDLSQKAQLIHATATQPSTIKMEMADSCDPIMTAMTYGESATTLTHHHRPTTIILTTTGSSSTTPAAFTPSVHTVQVKAEPMETYDMLHETVNIDGHTLIMPPTPPSSAGSDSDGSQSPQRSAPNSPQRQSPVRLYQYHHLHHHSVAFNPDTSTIGAQTLSQPLFLSPMPQSGVLVLTEEEKRTLISEGYPIPAKLPLTKQEEKNLKKVRRKIKNKISAQESRRKKKEYLEALEKRVEAYNHENSDLKKKVDSLEKNNHSLLSQLKALQAMVGKIPRSAAASATQTGTVLMVLVLCFAVFLGGSGGGTSSLNMGYSGVGPAPLSFQRPGPLRAHGPNMGPGVGRVEDTAGDYTTPNLKSRVLMAFSKEEPEDWCDEYRPLVPWERELSCAFGDDVNSRGIKPPAKEGVPDPGVGSVMPVINKAPVTVDDKTATMAVVTVAVGVDKNDKTETMAVVTVAVGVDKNKTESLEDYQAIMHPDIAVASPLSPRMGNFTTAELETA